MENDQDASLTPHSAEPQLALLRPAGNGAVRLTSPDFFLSTSSLNIGKDLFGPCDLKDRVRSLMWWQATMEHYAREAWLFFATVQDGLAVWVIMMMQAMSQRQPSAFATS